MINVFISRQNEIRNKYQYESVMMAPQNCATKRNMTVSRILSNIVMVHTGFYEVFCHSLVKTEPLILALTWSDVIHLAFSNWCPCLVGTECIK